ncbi:DHS-like NAD/FAD-binding domain-containing protein [Vararia minispora EC-137]|uniref:DHS-like NAD/FAD-binding domain-containing protein n=1 Tax=Vararia minispora EC-137 TaxID=1314806 RepID=A0ACB8QW65_9AGAM|nr:DHS-like NAD/FAD-binding domain-containing protein [Vararia minispora EC-137]
MAINPNQSTDMASFKRTLAASKHIIAVAGAGLSAASGIPTFRGAGGLWRSHNATSLATPEAFAGDPSRCWQFYHYRRETASRAKPNAAHTALAEFSLPSVRESIVPGSTFTLITQNVDGLSRIALDAATRKAATPEQPAPASESSPPAVAAQPPLLEMHGRLFEVVCTSGACKHAELDYASPLAPALAGTECLELEKRIERSDLPRCKKCGALARPGVVWFGETPQFLDEIEELVLKADLCLVVGTSSTVYPAAGYAAAVQEHGGKVAVFNLDRSEGDGEADFLFLGPCAETLPDALGLQKPSTLA